MKLRNASDMESSGSMNVYIDSERRTIFFHDVVTPQTMSLVCSAMQSFILSDDEMEATCKDFERQPIHLYINSPGGSLYDMWALIGIMLMTDTPIYTYCTGYAMSAAFIIFICGDCRFISPYATLMSHQLSSTHDGTYLDLAQSFDELTWIQSNSEQLICDFTKISPEVVKKIRTEKLDYYIHAKEALELGVADAFIGNKNVSFQEAVLDSNNNKVEEKSKNENSKKKKKKKKIFEKLKK